MSAWTDFPKKYKYTSMDVNLSYDQFVTNRETYDLLEFASDLGGLMGTLSFLGSVILGPILQYALNSHLARLLFLVKPINHEEGLDKGEDDEDI